MRAAPDDGSRREPVRTRRRRRFQRQRRPRLRSPPRTSRGRPARRRLNARPHLRASWRCRTRLRRSRTCRAPDRMKPSRDIATCKRIMLLSTVSEAKTRRSRGVQMLSSCRPSGQGLAASSFKDRAARLHCLGPAGALRRGTTAVVSCGGCRLGHRCDRLRSVATGLQARVVSTGYAAGKVRERTRRTCSRRAGTRTAPPPPRAWAPGVV
jgi:hypothetical protein